MKKIILSFVFLTLTYQAHAQSAYVSDELEIMVRSGQSSSHRIIATLKSGRKVNVIERDAASGYSKVKISDSKDGWVLTRLLRNTPSAKSRLAASEKKTAALSAELKTTKQQLDEVLNDKGNLDSVSSALKESNTKLERELAQLKETSQNAIQTKEERDQLQQRVVTIERELEEVKRENNTLKSSDAQDWFLVGAGVLFLGIILGFILPKISWRRKASWQSTF